MHLQTNNLMDSILPWREIASCFHDQHGTNCYQCNHRKDGATRRSLGEFWWYFISNSIEIRHDGTIACQLSTSLYCTEETILWAAHSILKTPHRNLGSLSEIKNSSEVPHLSKQHSFIGVLLRRRHRIAHWLNGWLWQPSSLALPQGLLHSDFSWRDNLHDIKTPRTEISIPLSYLSYLCLTLFF